MRGVGETYPDKAALAPLIRPAAPSTFSLKGRRLR
jgi:hypothetical protein